MLSLPREIAPQNWARATIIDNDHTPSITSLMVTPERPTTMDDIRITPVGWTDEDNDTPEYNLEVWKNSIPVYGLDGLLIPHALTAKHDYFSFKVTPTDGTNYGPTLTEDVHIYNSPPSLEGVTITTDEINGDLVFGISPIGSYDADDDALVEHYRWEEFISDRESFQKIPGETSSTISGLPVGTDFRGGIRLDDGETSSTWSYSSVARVTAKSLVRPRSWQQYD